MDGFCETKDSLHRELYVNTVLPSTEDIRMMQCGTVPCNMVNSLQNTHNAFANDSHFQVYHALFIV